MFVIEILCEIGRSCTIVWSLITALEFFFKANDPHSTRMDDFHGA